MLLPPCWVKHAVRRKDWMVEGWWSTYQQDEVLTLAGVSPGSGVLHQEVKMDLQETVFDKEVFREELRTQKLKVAKLEEQNLEIPEKSSGTEGQ